MGKKRAPASGEETAIAGYLAQYEFSAWTLLGLMRDNRLDAISVCDHAAGICDDLVVISRHELFAYQLKSQKYPAAFRLKTVLVENGLITEIAKSWSALKQEYPDKRICIRYVLSGFPSVNDKKNLSDIGHSAELLAFLADPDIELSKDTLLSSPWSPFIQELEKKSGLSENDFFEMFSQLRVYDQNELVRRQIENLDSYAAEKARQIKRLLPDIVAKRGAKKLWTEQDLLNELGWKSNLALRAVHSFPISKDVQVNHVVEGALRRVIDEHSSGYLSLIGPPGTGKSTTLQRAIVSMPRYGVARYLAFLPNERHGLGRAEAIDFLNDVTFALDKLGFSRQRLVGDDELPDEFLKQLEEAGDLFQSTGQKTLIIVDGLDHIQREENPQHNLLSILPQPQSVPDGVLFILGSQYLELDGLAPSIAKQASLEARCVEMAPLSKQAIFDMADKVKLPEHVERQALYDVCAGHPLVARYYIKKLSETETEERANSILASGEIGTNVKQVYELVLAKLDPDEDAKHVLGLLARADNRISPEELASVVNDVAVETVLKRAGFLLSGVEAGKWSIFHNSFRVFLGRETTKRFGKEDPSVDAALHSELADIAKHANSESDQYWLELRYRSRAGDTQAVQELAAPALFRKHLEEFRPSKDIYVDLRLAYGAIDRSDELPTLVQLMMTEKEIDYRLEVINQLDFIDIFLRFDELSIAYEFAIAGGMWTEGASALLDVLWRKDNLVRARSLFEAIEPAEYFFACGNRSVGKSELEDLYGWIEHAHRFRSLEQILEIVDGIPFDEYFEHDPTENLKLVLARGVLHDDPTVDVDELCSQIGLAESIKTDLLVQVASHLNDAGESARVRGLLARLSGQQAVGLSVANSRVCTRLAFQQGDHDLARRFLEGVRVSTNKHFREYGYRPNISGMLASTFSVARLSERLGVDVLLEASDTDPFQNKLLENVIRLGCLQGKLEMASDPRAVSVRDEIIKSCQFLALAELGEKHQPLDPISADSLRWYAKTLVGISALHGKATLDALEDQVEQLYTRDDTRLRFTPFRLTFASEIYRIDGDQDKAIARVRSLDSRIEEESSPHSAVELRVELAIALAEVDAFDQGKAELALIHNDTCGCWLAAKKEPQYVFWNAAFGRACSVVPRRAGELALEFARFVVGLADTEGSETGHRIAYGLIKNAARSPSHCAGIVSRFIGTHLVNWADIVAAVLHGIVLERPSLARQCFTLYGRLVVPFASDSVHKAIAPIYERLPDNQREEAEKAFVECAQMFADSSHEAELLSHLKNLVTSKNELLDRAHERSEHELAELRNEGERENRVYSVNEREKKLETIESLAALVSAGDGVASYGKKHVDYTYARRATDLLETASCSEIESFLHKRPIALEDAKFTISVTSRLMELGEKGKADQYYVLAEKLALGGSWSTWLGGEKIAFQKLRKKREGVAGEAAGFGAFVADLSHGRTSANMVLPDLDELIDLIAPDAPWDMVWGQVQEHLSVYREYGSTEPVEAQADISSHEKLLGHIFRIGFSLLCKPLEDRLREGLLDLAADPKGLQLFDLIVGMLVRDLDFHREVSAILWKLVDTPSCKEILIKHARELSCSTDAVVTTVARNVLYRFGIEVDMPSQGLPAFYELVVIGDKNAEKFELPPGVEPGASFWVDDPWFWTSAIGYQIKLVSEASGLEIEAIRRRCAEFMRAAGGEIVFGPLAEKKLLNDLKSLDLKFTYARLMPFYALRSLGQVIEELSRAGKFDFSVLDLLWPDLGGAPVTELKISREPRPDWVVPPSLPRINHWKIDADTWLQLGPDNSLVPIATGFFVLAEQASFAFSGNWKKCSVVRTSLPDSEWGCDPDENLFGMDKAVSLDYLGTVRKHRDLAILCTVDDPVYGELRDATLTLKQRILDELGWIRSSQRPFDIRDAEGSLVAVTRIWVDGLGYPDHRFEERSGHGHVVLISKKAKEELEARFGNLIVKTRVIQRYESSDDRQERVYFDALQSKN